MISWRRELGTILEPLPTGGGQECNQATCRTRFNCKATGLDVAVGKVDGLNAIRQELLACAIGVEDLAAPTAVGALHLTVGVVILLGAVQVGQSERRQRRGRGSGGDNKLEDVQSRATARSLLSRLATCLHFLL